MLVVNTEIKGRGGGGGGRERIVYARVGRCTNQAQVKLNKKPVKVIVFGSHGK